MQSLLQNQKIESTMYVSAIVLDFPKDFKPNGHIYRLLWR